MISFLVCISLLILAYFLYSTVVDRAVKPDPLAVTPAVSKYDGVDFKPLKPWKIFMIQFLNIAGTGPIFGAIMGAMYGPSCFVWIVLGCIFIGSVHDYLSGMISLRSGGLSLPDMMGRFMGKGMRTAMLVVCLLLLVIVGAVFIYSPAQILGSLAPVSSDAQSAVMFWVFVVLAYYVVATLLPIDKIIGKIYPLFAFSLIFMAIGLFVALLVKWPALPEIWEGIPINEETHGIIGDNILPFLCVVVSCGAISGFHATQSPMMARCMTKETQGRPIFYGAMITEGIVALIWAAIGSYFFYGGGKAELGMTSVQAPDIVVAVSKSWLGKVGGVLAILGVVAAPVTTGDTALRSARLIVSDFLSVEQKTIWKRILVSLPIFIVSGLLLWMNISKNEGFVIIWRYFGWFNQVLACMTLWFLTVWLLKFGKMKFSYMFTLPGAVFLTWVVVTFICVAVYGFNLPIAVSRWIGVAASLGAVLLFALYYYRQLKRAKSLLPSSR